MCWDRLLVAPSAGRHRRDPNEVWPSNRSRCPDAPGSPARGCEPIASIELSICNDSSELNDVAKVGAREIDHLVKAAIENSSCCGQSETSIFACGDMGR